MAISLTLALPVGLFVAAQVAFLQPSALAASCNEQGKWVWGEPVEEPNDPVASHTPDQKWTLAPFGTVVGTSQSTAEAGRKGHTANYKITGSGETTGGTLIGDASGTQTANASISFKWQRPRKWQGPEPKTARSFQLTANGTGTIIVSSTCGANMGSSAGASGACAGTASSLGKASASFTIEEISVNSQYNSVTKNFEIKGNLGAKVENKNTTVDISVKEVLDWKVAGTGTANTSAAYAVKAEDRWQLFENSTMTYTLNGSGTIGGGGSGSCGEPGSFGFGSNGNMSMYVESSETD